MRRNAIIAIVIALVGGILVLAAIQRSLIFPRHLVRAPGEPRDKPAAAEQWWLETDEGPVEAWYLPGEGRSADEPGPAVIFAHGNGEVIDLWANLLRWYADRRIGALLVEYRGYGRSKGNPSTGKVTDDLIAFRQRLIDRPEVDPDRLIYHGRSLGGGAVCALADRHEPAALILQSTFTSLSDLAWHHYMAPSFLLRDEFDNEAYLAEADIPVFLSHGIHDEIIPVGQARQLHRAAPDSELLELECGHNDCPMRWDRIAGFLESVFDS